MTEGQLNSLKSGLESGLIDQKTAEQIIGKHEAKDIEQATQSAKAHSRQIRADLGIPQPIVGPLAILGRQTKSQPFTNPSPLRYSNCLDQLPNPSLNDALTIGKAVANLREQAHNAALAETDNTRIGY